MEFEVCKPRSRRLEHRRPSRAWQSSSYVVAAGELTDDEVGDLELAIERAEAYEKQESTIGAETEADTKGDAARSEAAKTPREKKEGAPRVDLSAMESFHFILEGDASTMDDAAKEAAKASKLADAEAE